MSLKLSGRPTALTVLLGSVVLALTACGGGSASKKESVKQSATHQMQLARSMMGAGRISEALEAVEVAIADEPDNPSLHLYLGQLCLNIGMLERAEGSFNKALELDPYITDAHTFLGAVYQDMGKLPEAEASYRAALENPAYPTPEKVYLGLGMLYVAQGRDPEAETNLRRAVGINTKYYYAHYQLALLLERTERLKEAGREYEVAEPGFRQDAEYWYRRGFNLYRLGDRYNAMDSLLRVRNIAPGSESAARADELLSMME